MKFKVGDTAMAKWPGSSLYFRAKVVEIDEEEGVAEVLYEDGTEMDVPLAHLQNEAVFKRKAKSPARTRRRSRSRSPGRSPARQRKTPAKAVEKKQTRNNKSATSSASSSEDTKVATVRKSERFEQKAEVKEVKTFGVEKIVSRTYQSKVVVEKVADNDLPAKLTTMKSSIVHSAVAATPTHRYEFGGPFGAFFQYVICPLWPIVIMTCCDTSKCELRKFNLFRIPRELTAYYDPVATLIVMGFLLFNALIYALPLGSVVNGPDSITGKKTRYRISALYSLFFTAVAYGALVYFKYPVTMVLDKLFPMMITCLELSYLFNFLLHLKSLSADKSDLNPRANTGCTIYDVFMGRELHPKFGKYFQLKLYVYRIAMNASLLVSLLYLQNEFTLKKHNVWDIKPAIALLAGTQILYSVLVFFSDEEQTLYSFDIKHEGLGFQNLFGNLVVVPFLYTINLRYATEHRNTPDTPIPIMVTYGLLVFIGLVLIVGSGLIKKRFRQNPYDPSLSSLESMPPSKRNGSRLLISGYWGLVRHPNYLGEILIGVAYGLICGFDDILPWMYVIFVTGLLIHRSLRDDERCQEKHGYAWKEYCKRVRYRVIPFVF